MKKMGKLNEKWTLIAGGVVVGLIGIVLSLMGNPANMAICVACFLRDISGAIGFHQAAAVQYIRPEVIGIILGALIISVANKEFAPKGGSSPLIRFVFGICVMIGALVFLGCPMRMILRMAGGDLTALVGLVGFAAGIISGIVFLNKGFSLKRAYDQTIVEGAVMPMINVLLLIAVIAAPAFIFFSETGPGAARAPILISLMAGLIAGAVSQRSRLCFVGGIRDVVMFREFRMLVPFLIILGIMMVGNIITGQFNFGFVDQPISHNEWLWNIMGLYIVGLGSVLLGGCPFRQLVLAGSGNTDAGITVLGLMTGAAISHNFGLASSGAGTTIAGQFAVWICIAVIFGIALFSIRNSIGNSIGNLT